METNTERKVEGRGLSPVGPHTREEQSAEEDTESPKLTQKVRSAKYDLNHSSAMPLMPTHCLKREINIS